MPNVDSQEGSGVQNRGEAWLLVCVVLIESPGALRNWKKNSSQTTPKLMNSTALYDSFSATTSKKISGHKILFNQGDTVELPAAHRRMCKMARRSRRDITE